MAINNVDPLNPVVLNVAVLKASLPDNKIRTFMVVSAGDTNLATGTSKLISLSEIATVFDTTTQAYKTSEAYITLSSFFSNNNSGSVYVLETGKPTVADDVSDYKACIEVLATYIANGKNLAYGYAIPRGFPSAQVEIKQLMSQYSDVTSQTGFLVETSANIDPDTDVEYKNLAGLKAYIGCVPSTVSTESVTGAILGRMASPIYNLSASNVMTPLQYKEVVGITPREFTTELRLKIVNASLNYVGTLQNATVIMNGRCGDNFAWDYWYSFDFLSINIVNSLINALRNGANVPSAVIRYNQDGITALKSVIVNQLKNGKSNGTVTDFAQAIDPITNTYVGLSDINAIPYFTYKADNPAKYQAEIYDGFSAIITIGRFIRQVVFNMTID